MSALPWATTLAALDSALTGLATGSPMREIGDDIRFRLNTTGLVYDAVWTPEIDAAKTAGDALYADALTDFDTATQTAFTQADDAAKVVEGAQHNAQASEVQPYVGTAGGERYALAPGVSMPYDASEAPGASAARNLLASSTPVLRVVAKDGGVWGGTVEVQVTRTNATLGQIFVSPNGVPGTYTVAVPAKGYIDATYIAGSGSDAEISSVAFRADDVVTLSARRGASGYSESYVLTLGQAVNVKASLLLGSVEWFPGAAALPSNLAWSFLTGGAGGGVGALRTRLQRAAKLPACSPEQASVLNQLVPKLVAQAGGAPSYPITATTYAYAKRPAVTRVVAKDGTSYLAPRVLTDVPAGTNVLRLSVRELQGELQDLVDEADNFLALLS